MASLPKKLLISKPTLCPPPRPTTPSSHLHYRNMIESHFISLLESCTTFLQLKQVHSQIISNNLNQNNFLLTKLIRSLTKLNIPIEPYSTKIFHKVSYPNPFLYTSLIRGYCTEKNQRKAVILYNQMRKNYVDPVSFTFTCLLKSCSEEKNLFLGTQMHNQSVKIGGFGCDVFVCNTLIDMYVKCGEVGGGRKVFDEMPERDLISWTTLIMAYAKDGDMMAARELFGGLVVKDMVAWTAMVTGFAQNAKPREALEYFEMMLRDGVEVDELTLVGVISACAQLGAIKYGNWVRDVAERLGFGPKHSVFVGSALIDMYSKCGSVMEAYEVFKGMRVKNVYSYSSMIVGFAVHGCGKAAFDLFQEMVKTDIKPNKVTFIGVLSACSHSGLVDEGRKYFDMMEKSYGVVPHVDHYTCLVDLLGRAGQLEEALQVIRNMPMEPHGGIWGAVLGACRIHKNPDVAEFAANHLFELEPDGIGNYVLLANIYASAGRWEGVQKVRMLMRERGLRKNPACSWVEDEKGIIHEFYSRDVTHPKSKEIELVLKDLLDRLKLHGYQPNLSSVPYDVGEEDKKRILLTHSEKLALAYALLTSDNGLTIRIMKNLRICEDCHLFMCAASQITCREIIVRDNAILGPAFGKSFFISLSQVLDHQHHKPFEDSFSWTELSMAIYFRFSSTQTFLGHIQGSRPVDLLQYQQLHVCLNFPICLCCVMCVIATMTYRDPHLFVCDSSFAI